MSETTDMVIADLHKIITEIENGEFIGALSYSNVTEKAGWYIANGGTAEDRLNLVDSAWRSMNMEKRQDSRDWFFGELYERFKLLKPDSLTESDKMIS
jgi:hypothetical protein